jgi:hypothetical protein
MARWLVPFLILVVPSSARATQGPPASPTTFVGDIACASGDPAAFNQLMSNLPEAIQMIGTFDPAAAAEIQQAWNSGAVNFVPLDATTGSGLAGAADHDTVGLDADLPDGELATALYHEWHHVRQTRPLDQNGLPEEALLSEACRETFAYDAEMAFVCHRVAEAQADLAEKPFDCHFILSTWSQLHLMRLSCLLGSPGTPVPPLPTPCTGYCQ